MELRMSTASEYIDAIKATDHEWPVRHDDMMPLAEDKNNYWSGYFTSRTQSKKLSRQTSSHLHAATKLYSESMLNSETDEARTEDILTRSDQLFDAMGIMQHHDAITGTELQAVADDYIRILEGAL